MSQKFISPEAKQFAKILQSPTEVQARITEIADEILVRYGDTNPLFICLLRGGAPFASQLMFALAKSRPSLHPELDYMTLRTYGDSLTGKDSELVMDLAPSTVVTDRPVVVLDDVLDEGYTATFVTKLMKDRGAASVDLVVLVQKMKSRKRYPCAAIFGFEAPADWLTGMGMDDARIKKEANRWLNFLAIANE